MTQVDYDTIKIRASLLPKIIPKKGKLTLKGKSELDLLFLEKSYGRRKIFSSKQTEKGTEREDDSISLYRTYHQLFTKKNKRRIHTNPYIDGEYDLMLYRKFKYLNEKTGRMKTGKKKHIVDIKTCWDIFTFNAKDRKKALDEYFWQIAGYCLLTGAESGSIAYVLLNNTDEAIESEYQKMKWQLRIYDDETPEAQELYEQIRYNNTYDDIPLEERIKEYEFEVTQDHKDTIELIVSTQVRDYLKKKTL